MNFIENSKKFGHVILDLIFPITCVICGKDGVYLCRTCLLKLPKLDKQQCLICQQPSPFGKTHMECSSRNGVDGIISALSYPDKHIKKIIEVLKYNFVSELADPLVVLTIEEISKQNLIDYFSQFIIVPVPLHSRRYNWRGFNQAELLAHKISAKLNSSMNENLIERVRFTKPQTQLSQIARKSNVANAFNVNKSIEGKKILIIDDVVTTGATINEIAKLMKRHGAVEVWGLTVCRG